MKQFLNDLSASCCCRCVICCHANDLAAGRQMEIERWVAKDHAHTRTHTVIKTNIGEQTGCEKEKLKQVIQKFSVDTQELENAALRYTILKC